MQLSGTIAPWLLGVLGLLTLLTIAITMKAWRDAKTSPYFFLRRQALKRMQSYFMASLALLAATGAAAAYSWQPPQDTTLRYAAITNAKPVQFSLSAARANSSALDVEDDIPEVVQYERYPGLEQTRNGNGDLTQGEASLLQTGSSLPEEFNRVEPRAPLNNNTELGDISFSTSVTDRYEPINPDRRFVAGHFRLYATFTYEGMVNGMAWSWVWRFNGEAVSGGNEIWNYGSSGPGYIYLAPEEGFQPGQYTLEVWVNGERRLTQGAVTITPGVSAGN